MQMNNSGEPQVAAGLEGSNSRELASDLPLKLGKPAQRALAAAGYVRLEQLTKVSEAQLLQLHGMGPKALAQLRDALTKQGLAFADVAAPSR
jgi:hypothetical protein